MESTVERDFGDNAKSQTAKPNGIIASGKPTVFAAFIALIVLSTAAGFPKPTSSYAITVKRLSIEIKSSETQSFAK